MPGRLEFFFDYVSPFSYLANSQLPGIAQRTGAELVYRPMFLGGVMQATGNQPPATLPARAKYMPRDIQRWVRRYRIEFAPNTNFPMQTLVAMRTAIAAQGAAEGEHCGGRGAGRVRRAELLRRRRAVLRQRPARLRGRGAGRGMTQKGVALVVGAAVCLGSAVARRMVPRGRGRSCSPGRPRACAAACTRRRAAPGPRSSICARSRRSSELASRRRGRRS